MTAKQKIKELKKELHHKEKALAETAALQVLRKSCEPFTGRTRGRLTSTDERQRLIALIHALTKAVAGQRRLAVRPRLTCAPAGAVIKTEKYLKRPTPENKLTEQERQAIIDVCNQLEYASLPPTQIVPVLLDKGDYTASESIFYRVLKAVEQLNRRGRERGRQKASRPTSYTATKPNQVYTLDIT